MSAPSSCGLALYVKKFFIGCCSSVCKAIAIVTGIHNGFLGTRTVVGRLLDVKRIVAGANRPMAELRIFRPRVQSSRSSLLWPDRAVLDWAPVQQYLSRLLYRSVPPASANSADPFHCAPAFDHSRLLRHFSTGGFRLAVDPARTIGRVGHYRLRVGDLSLCGPTFRRTLTLPFTRRPQRMHLHEEI